MKKPEKINIKEALRYLGYKKEECDDETLSIMEKCGEELLLCCNPRFVYRVFDLKSDEDAVKIENADILLTGNSIKKHLSGCERIAFFAATLSSEADLMIKSFSVGSMREAVITDALANTLIEQVCDMVEDEIVKSSGCLHSTKRFSPGYGDLPVTLQNDILVLLDAEKRIGLHTTDSSLLVPMKSVTAIIGLSDYESDDKIKKSEKSCDDCNLKDNCEYRKRSERCAF